MVGHHQKEAIKQLISNIIPSSKVSITRKENITWPKDHKVITITGECAGIHWVAPDEIEFWIQCEKNCHTYDVFVIKRLNIPFTKLEKMVLCALPQMCCSITLDDKNKTVHTHKSIVTQFALPYLLISCFMRGTNPSRVGTPITSLVLLQKLSYKRYEGSFCTSGFLCLKTLKGTIPLLSNNLTNYEYEPFHTPVLAGSDFFDKPLSYRYVDGKNTFYVVDHHGMVGGIVRIKSPNQFNLIDRITFRHVEELKSIPGFRWLAYSGLHGDVLLHTNKKMIFQWDSDIWKLRDLNHLHQLICDHKVDSSFAIDIATTIFTLSELRQGALLLISQNGDIPQAASKIDKTTLGSVLCEVMRGHTFHELIKTNSILGLLTSDGLASFDSSGNLINCGEIIDLSGMPPSDNRYAGGGRSQAACAASMYGLAIKVSEDGPITLFHHGQKIMEWK